LKAAPYCGSPGSPGTGGGGGGGGSSPTPGTPTTRGTGGQGGGGVIILAVPNSSYPGAYNPIASNPPNAAGLTVLTFTTSGSYLA
jgi:hypothetical protein